MSVPVAILSQKDQHRYCAMTDSRSFTDEHVTILPCGSNDEDGVGFHHFIMGLELDV